MSTINGTITGCTLVRAKGARKAYQLTVDFAAYTGSTDDAAINGIGVAIASRVRNGKTNTLRSVVCVGAGIDTNAQDIYVGGASVAALTVSGDNATGNLVNAANTEVTSSTACRGVEIVVVVDES